MTIPPELQPLLDALQQERDSALVEALRLRNELDHRDSTGISVRMVTLREERDRLRASLDQLASDFCCIRCRDGHTPLYCLNCANDILP